MSTSLLDHGFGVRGYEYVRTEYVEGQIRFSIRQPRKALRCSARGSRAVRPRGTAERPFRTPPIGSRLVLVSFPIPRVCCQHCGVTRQVALDFAGPRRTYTKAFERYAPELSLRMTTLDVARHPGVSWDVIEGIRKRDLSRRYARPRLKHLRHIAIDEIAAREGHRYLTVVLDLGSGAVALVGDGKGGAALKPFRRRLRRCKAKVEAVAMDMSAAYREAVAAHLPKAAIVCDHSHVIEPFNDKLSDLRRSLYHEANGDGKGVLKGARWLLLKAPEEPRPGARRGGTPGGGLEVEPAAGRGLRPQGGPAAVLGTAGQAVRHRLPQLNGWLRRAEASGVRRLQQMAKTLEAHRAGLLAYYAYPISTGPPEGTNNKIKTLKRQAYGFRDQEFFKLKILAIHETKYALVG